MIVVKNYIYCMTPKYLNDTLPTNSLLINIDAYNFELSYSQIYTTPMSIHPLQCQCAIQKMDNNS